ncbi:MAG: ATP-binding protein [Anaerolineae bacterium]
MQSQSPNLEEARQREAQLEALHRARLAVSRAINPQDAILAIHHHACVLSQADVCRIVLSNSQDFASALSALPPVDPAQATALEELSHQAMTTGQHILAEAAASPEDNNALPSWLALPLSTEGKVLGALCLGHRRAGAFTPPVVDLLAAFADQAAIAIENARLFQNLSTAYVDLSQSREKILDHRNILQALFDGFTDGLYVVDKTLTVLMVNQAEATRLKQTVSEIEGKTCADLGWAEAAPELLENIREVFARGRALQWSPAEISTARMFKDREVQLYPVRNPQQEIARVVVFAQDVSERRQLQASLFQSANLAALGQLATSVAHEINNPLTVAVANSQIILMDKAADPKRRDLAQAIFEAGQRIQRIVANLVEFSNQETYLFNQVDLVHNIEGALALVAHPLQREEIAVARRFDCQPSLIASSSHLKMVWMNLLLNARDAILAAERAGQVRIHVAQDAERPGEVFISISDNGIGIPADDYEQLFRPFFTTKQTGKALGLGLFTAHAIVERHNGRITVESQVDRGSTFTVFLPLKSMPQPSPLPLAGP